MKNALFVGSFNPVTKSHIKIASDLLKNKVLDYIYFIPVNSKKINLVKIDHRITMLDLVIKNNMEVLDIYNYSENGMFNYRVLDYLNEKFKITHLILGSDLLLKFKTFTEYEHILKNYYLIIIKRDDFKISMYLEMKFKNYLDRFIIIDKDYFASSTKARNSLNEKNNKYLEKKVLDYIKKFNLYN